MRKSLFRGIDKCSGKWRYGSVVSDKDLEDVDIYTYEEDEQGRIAGFDVHSVHPETVGQYTGVEVPRSHRTGEHALKVFEGDEVEDEYGIMYTVEFHGGGFYAVTEDGCDWLDIGDIEVITSGYARNIKEYLG